MRKRVISVVVSLMLMFSLNLTAFADEQTTVGEVSDTQVVNELPKLKKAEMIQNNIADLQKEHAMPESNNSDDFNIDLNNEVC